MPPDRRTLRAIRSAYVTMKKYQRNTGQWVWWFRFDQSDTTSDATYDVGPGRLWYNPVKIPVLSGEFIRAPRNIDDDGLYRVDTAHLIMSYDQFFGSQIQDPDSTGADHVRDRVAFDGRLFYVTNFLPRGRIADYFLTISIDLREVAIEDLAQDPQVPMFQQYLTAGFPPVPTSPPVPNVAHDIYGGQANATPFADIYGGDAVTTPSDDIYGGDS